MVDIHTFHTVATVVSTAKPLVKAIWRLRPQAMMKNAQHTELRVAQLLLSSTDLLSEQEFMKVQISRAKVDTSRARAEKSSWKSKGPRHLHITYKYYSNTGKLLALAQTVTENTLRHKGPEGQRVAAMAAIEGTGPSAPAAVSNQVNGLTVSCVLNNVVLQPGTNTIPLPLLSDAPQLAHIEIKITSIGTYPPERLLEPVVSMSDDLEVENISETFSLSDQCGPNGGDSDVPDDHEYHIALECDGEEDTDDDSGYRVEASIQLARMKGKGHWYPRDGSESGPSFEIDITESTPLICENEDSEA
ncbi:hypothetical protein C8Q77DRAFT_1157494 [Trametes polyzona]|nr:hypothetical protein C8Q77DRAFT_1157494 [Trametes polyzona]